MVNPTIKLGEEIIKDNLFISHLEEKTIHVIHMKNHLDEKLSIEYLVPLVDIQFLWHPMADGVLALKNEWDEPLRVRLNQSMPVFCLLNQSNMSPYSFGISDLVSELQVTIGVHEESASVKVKIETIVPNNDYKLAISLMSTSYDWFKSVNEQVSWLYSTNQISIKEASDSCYEPVLSTWYSFHQSINEKNIFQEAKNYLKLGTKTIILDDGWQTDDGNRRYAYAGEWKVSQNKFPNFSKHVNTVQALGMNYLVWLSLPYLGIKSSKWSELKKDVLYLDDFQRAGVLDIRKPNVQAYLLETVDSLVREYSLNGLKIDFLETFFLKETDSYEISQSLLTFFGKLQGQLANQENFMIEFRQDYISPLMMQFCNIIRAKDCPNNYFLNRIRTIDLRLSCPSTAVHSDMIMWNRQETIEDAALHIINTLFSVPQLSMSYEKLSSDEIKMIDFWLSFMSNYQKLLLKSNFEPLYPQEGYSIVTVHDKKMKIVVSYSEDRIVSLMQNIVKQIIVINGTKQDKVTVKMSKGLYRLVTYTCVGDKVDTKKIKISENQILELEVPKSGLVKIEVE